MWWHIFAKIWIEQPVWKLWLVYCGGWLSLIYFWGDYEIDCLLIAADLILIMESENIRTLDGSTKLVYRWFLLELNMIQDLIDCTYCSTVRFVRLVLEILICANYLVFLSRGKDLEKLSSKSSLGPFSKGTLEILHSLQIVKVYFIIFRTVFLDYHNK